VTGVFEARGPDALMLVKHDAVPGFMDEMQSMALYAETPGLLDAADLRRGSFSDLAADLFTIDKGAIIGLEYRFAITGNIQAGVHRSLLSKTIQTFGRFRLVNPTVVLEVAFNGIQRSNRHKSGYALRFPRILRIRTDKTPDDIDTLESVEKIYTSANHEEG